MVLREKQAQAGLGFIFEVPSHHILMSMVPCPASPSGMKDSRPQLSEVLQKMAYSIFELSAIQRASLPEMKGFSWCSGVKAWPLTTVWVHGEGTSQLCSSVTHSCLTLCSLMDCSMPAFPVLHHFPEFAQTCSLSPWCNQTISSSVVPFSSCLQSHPASRSFPVSQFFASGGQSILELQHQSFHWIFSVDFL